MSDATMTPLEAAEALEWLDDPAAQVLAAHARATSKAEVGPRPSAEFPAVDPTHDLPAAVELIRRIAAEQHPYDGVLLGLAADVLEAVECSACDGTGTTHTPGHYVPGQQFVEPPTGPDMCGPCRGTGHLATTPPAQGPPETEAGERLTCGCVGFTATSVVVAGASDWARQCSCGHPRIAHVRALARAETETEAGDGEQEVRDAAERVRAARAASRLAATAPPREGEAGQ